MTHEERTLRYFKTHKRGLTPFDMWIKLGIYRGSDTIYKLRQDGHDIKTDYINVKNHFGETCRVAYYTYKISED